MTTLAGALIFIAFGILFALIQIGITFYLRKKEKNTVLMQIIGILTNAMFVFTLMWVYASAAERVYQAVGMSVVFFGGVTLVFAVVFWRLTSLKKDYRFITSKKKMLSQNKD